MPEEKIERPERMPRTPPPEYPGSEYSFVLQTVFDLKGSLGELQGAVTALKETVTGQGKTLNWIKYILSVAIGALLVIGYLVDKRFDQILGAIGAP